METLFFFHVYLSSAVHPFTHQEIVELLEHCRDQNPKVGITGILLYKDGNFMQVVEGAKSDVNNLLKKIHRDRRHHGIIGLLEGTTESRQFPEWTMGFRDLNSAEVKLLPGYSEFLNTPLTAAEFKNSPSRCQKLLMNFKKNLR